MATRPTNVSKSATFAIKTTISVYKNYNRITWCFPLVVRVVDDQRGAMIKTTQKNAGEGAQSVLDEQYTLYTKPDRIALPASCRSTKHP